MSATHDHPHADPHAHHPEHHVPSTYYEKLTTALMELLVEKKLFKAEDVQGAIERMEERRPERGARMVAKAWVDPAFKQRMLEDGSAAMRELGMEPGDMLLTVMENTPQVHNVIVCTLCSCYPRMLMGPPPAWYKSRPYRARVVREPRAVLAEFGLQLPEGVTIRVHDSSADLRYLVLPMRPTGTERWSEERLAALVTRDSMVGVAVARMP
ncbi:MAG TPA: nitrile hydratase subunit alpha [Candidatus Binatia bacterium]|nr:nitrile hydratase subunit alpha [Candidatus Binatia bacterium]